MIEYEVTSSWVEVPVVDEEQAGGMAVYPSRPEAPGHFPTVLVGFEMFGITAYIRSVADRIAALGYTAVVPDFYHRLADERIELEADADGRARGIELLQRIDRAGVVRDVQAVLDHLAASQGGRVHAAFVGFSVGGHLAFYAATQISFDALAVFYPGWLTDTGIALSRPEPTLVLTPEIAHRGTRMLFLCRALVERQ